MSMFKAYKILPTCPNGYTSTVSSTVRETHSASRFPRSLGRQWVWENDPDPSLVDYRYMCMRAPTSGCGYTKEEHQTACDNRAYWLTGRANRPMAQGVQRGCLEPFSALAFPRQPGTCWLLLMTTSHHNIMHVAADSQHQLMPLNRTAQPALSR